MMVKNNLLALGLCLLGGIVSTQVTEAKKDKSDHAAATPVQAAAQETVSPAEQPAPSEVSTGCCGNVTIISALPFVIANPGTYSLSQNFDYSPPGGNAPAITINASNVRLDLCGHTITHIDGMLGAVGIKISEGLKNIEITNGTIYKFRGAAINAVPSTKSIDTLSLSYLTITDNGDGTESGSGAPANNGAATGINLVSSPAHTFLSNIKISHCKIERNSISGLRIVGADNVVIEDTEINDTFATQVTHGVVGAYFQDVSNIQLLKSTFNSTHYTGTNASGLVHVSGALFLGCTSLFATECQFNKTFAKACESVSGFVALDLTDALFVECQFNNTAAGEEAILVSGFASSRYASEISGSKNLKFIHCQSNGSTLPKDAKAQDEVQIVAGMIISGSNVTLEDSQASGIHSKNECAHVYGYLFSDEFDSGDALDNDMENLLVKGSRACDISGEGKDKNVCGFVVLSQRKCAGAQGTLSNVVFQDSIAERIHGTDCSATVAGIAEMHANGRIFELQKASPFRCLIDLKIVECIVTDVKGCADRSAGILVESVKNPLIHNNEVSDCVVGILLTGCCTINPPCVFQIACLECDALSCPALPITLCSPECEETITFRNCRTNTQIKIDCLSTNIKGNSIISPCDLNSLGWRAGDKIEYTICDDRNPLPCLEPCGFYFLVVFSQGFTEGGLIQNNSVTDCSVAGFKDLAQPTQNAFIDNTAFNNGIPSRHRANYAINWKEEAPICAGDLGRYPQCQRPFNLSLVPCAQGSDIQPRES